MIDKIRLLLFPICICRTFDVYRPQQFLKLRVSIILLSFVQLTRTRTRTTTTTNTTTNTKTILAQVIFGASYRTVLIWDLNLNCADCLSSVLLLNYMFLLGSCHVPEHSVTEVIPQLSNA